MIPPAPLVADVQLTYSLSQPTADYKENIPSLQPRPMQRRLERIRPGPADTTKKKQLLELLLLVSPAGFEPTTF